MTYKQKEFLKKTGIRVGIILALALILKLIIYMSTGWQTAEVDNFQVYRVASTQWMAHYSGIDYEGEMDWWTEPASDISQETYVNRHEDITVGFKYPTPPVKYMDIEKRDLDEVKLHIEDSFYIISSHGDEHLYLDSSYIEALGKRKREETIKARYHHGTFRSYKLGD